MLSRYLVDEELASSAVVLTYFFFLPNDHDRNTISTALCAILHQLYKQRQQLVRHAATAFAQNGKQAVREPWTLWDMFQQSSGSTEAGDIICVLDGLDECEEKEVWLFFEMLKQFRSNSQNTVKFLLTSRPYFRLRLRFRDAERHLPVLYVAGADESDSLSRDVETFIRSRVHQHGTILD